MTVAPTTLPDEVLAKPKPVAPLALPNRDLVYEVEQFLYREARLLEAERYEEWLSTVTEDIRYWMPLIQARYRKDKAPLYSRTRMAHFDEDMLNLRRRVTRAIDATAWAEDPPTRSRNLISNIQVELTDREDEFVAHSVILNCRGRGEYDEDWLIARRQDVLRRVDGQLRLASREIYTTQSVILSKNINILL